MPTTPTKRETIMLTYDYRRADWGARPAKSRVALVWAKVRHLVVHWPGTAGVIGLDVATIARYLRGWQAYHQDDRGWSDIAYGVGVDQAGRVWELRGRDVRDGATSGHGGISQSILAILGAGEDPSLAMLAAIARVAADMRGSAPDARIVGHRALVTTSCPGQPLADWIARGMPADPGQLPAPAHLPPTTAKLAEDGLWGVQTIRAVQAWVGAPVDGIEGPRTRRGLQAKLGVTQDAIWGPVTTRALQRLVGATVDGVWGRETTRALQRWLNARTA